MLMLPSGGHIHKRLQGRFQRWERMLETAKESLSLLVLKPWPQD